MKTKHLLLFLLWTISLAGGWAGELPRGRIGDTRAQCVARFGEPIETETIGGGEVVTFRDGDWIVRFSFHHGRADLVDYIKAAGYKAAFPRSEIDAVLGQNGDGRPWRATKDETRGSPLLTADKKGIDLNIEWRTEDTLLKALFGTYTNRLIVSTMSYHKRASEPTLVNRADARRAWSMGILLGSMPGAYLDDPDAKKAPKRVAEIHEFLRLTCAAQAPMAADRSIALPELPARTGDRAADYDAVMKFVSACNGKILKAIRGAKTGPGEPGIAPCFEMGLTLPLWPFLYRLPAPEPQAAMLEGFAKAAQDSQLPANLWEPVDAKARATAPLAELEAAIAEAIPAITKYLDDKKGETASAPAAGVPLKPLQKPPVLNPEPEVAPQAKPPDAVTQFKDKLQQLKDKHRAEDLNYLRDSKKTWLAGLSAGRAATELFATDSTAAQPHLEKARAHLADIKDGAALGRKFALPDLPVKTGNADTDRDAVLQFVGKCRKAVEASGLGEEELFELEFPPTGYFRFALYAQVLRVIYADAPAGKKAQLFREVQGAARYSFLPEHLWQPILAKGQAGMSPEEFNKAVVGMIRDITIYMEAEEKKLSPVGASPTDAKGQRTPAKPTLPIRK